MRRNVSMCSRKYKSLGYISLVRPHLEYASAVWDPHYGTHVDLLNRVQNRAARFCMGDYRCTSSVSHMVNQLGWPLLSSRRKTNRLLELYKAINGLSPVPCDLLQRHNAPYRTRSTVGGISFVQPFCKTNSFKYSFFPRTVADWNMLPHNITTLPTLDQFHKQVNYLYQ